MHYLMLVTITMLPGETSLEVRQRIHDELAHDETFCGDGGRFSTPVCDWFEIGGGLLRETVTGDGSSSTHDADFILGCDDDAMPLDRTLYDRLLAEYRGKSTQRLDQFHYAFVDLDDEALDETFIGRKWIAVVDYHS